MRPARLNAGRDRGVTLLELVVAVAVLALGSAAAWRSYDAARRGVGGQIARALALELVQSRAAELRLGLIGLPDRQTMGGIVWTIEHIDRTTEGGLVETEIRANAPGRAGARLTVWRAAP